MASLDWKKIRTFPLAERKSKVSLEDFAKPPRAGGSFRDFYESLPSILAGNVLREVVSAILEARERSRPVIVCMGGHIVKCGLSPVLIDLIERDVITFLAMNGAAAIHDFEIALSGRTSEEVAESLDDGTFGMTEETGRRMNEALKRGAESGRGAGAALAEAVGGGGFPHKEVSLLYRMAAKGPPSTVHIAVGCDIIHQHPSADGSALGRSTFLDFQRFTEAVADLEGGVLMNAGSAVVMPEVFLKALTIARNLGKRVERFTAVNLDMIQHYRPGMNVVKRPVRRGGKGYAITGHHEVLIPFLAWAIREGMGRGEP